MAGAKAGSRRMLLAAPAAPAVESGMPGPAAATVSVPPPSMQPAPPPPQSAVGAATRVPSLNLLQLTFPLALLWQSVHTTEARIHACKRYPQQIC